MGRAVEGEAPASASIASCGSSPQPMQACKYRATGPRSWPCSQKWSSKFSREVVEQVMDVLLQLVVVEVVEHDVLECPVLRT